MLIIPGSSPFRDVLLFSHLVCDYADIDECASNNGGCCAQAVCKNTLGSYTCTCRLGYTGDGKTCRGELTYAFKKFQ